MNLRNLFAGLALLASVGAAHAVYTIDILEVGPDVVMSGSGSIDTTGMPSAPGNTSCGIFKGYFTPLNICIGDGIPGTEHNGVISPPLSGLTSGTGSFASIATGLPLIVSADSLYMPSGYASGTSLSNQSTYPGLTLALLGFTDGATQTLNLSSGDTIVIRIGSAVPPAASASPASIPTLSEYALMALASAVAMLGIAAARRKRG